MKSVHLLWLFPMLSCVGLDATEEPGRTQLAPVRSPVESSAKDASTSSLDEMDRSRGARPRHEGCSDTSTSPRDADAISASHRETLDFLLTGVRLPGGSPVDIGVKGGWITRVSPPGELALQAPKVVDFTDKWVVPAFIDSHVHLSYLPATDAMIDGGIAGAVDLAAPVNSFLEADSNLEMVRAGPMITAVGGYPTRSWGSNGYGLECSDAESVEASVQLLAGLGAGVIKLPIGHGPTLGEAAFVKAVDTAHEMNLPVAVHALDDEAAALAATMGADILAHTPVGPLSDETVELWKNRAVISTLAAFGGSEGAKNNLENLRNGGVRILYGTDFGNTSTPGIQPNEIALLMDAGFTGAEIVAAGTSVPAQFWGFTTLGTIEEGRAASLLVLSENPYENPMILAQPDAVLNKGKWR